MANGQYIALSAAVAHGTQLEVIANNLANVNTAGYKQLRTSFDQFLVDAKGQSSKGFTAVSSMKADLSAGTMQQTGNPLDVSIHGSGFFMVRTPQGDRLTRAGSFRIAQDGALLDSGGHAVLTGSASGQRAPIRVSGDGPVTITPAGDVEQDGTIVARLAIVDVTAEELTAMGDATYDAPPNALVDVTAPELATGFIESSNVNAIRGMVDLIETTRAYEQSQRLMSQYQRLDRRTIDIV